MKKLIAFMLSALMILSLAACGNSDTGADNKDLTDMEYVKKKGSLVVGITEFKPMDYKDVNGEWIGFDADMAKGFAEYLGVDVEFIIIDWNSKIMELEGKTIDCVWNGMTLTDEVVASMECSNPYCENAQVVIVPCDVADQYQTIESLANLQFAVEDGSSGEDAASITSLNYTEVLDQATALFEVKSKTADAAIIDSLMAGAMVGAGTDYADLTYTVSLTTEEYGVGFRKGSDLAAELNKYFAETYADGTMMEFAETYRITDTIIPQ